MTFILTELTELGIVMAADSSETLIDSSGNEDFQECDKIIFVPEFNIGISTWGYAVVENKGINEWLADKIDEFKRQKTGKDLKNKFLEEFANWIADKLNVAFPNGESVLGLHITGYTKGSGRKEYSNIDGHSDNHGRSGYSGVSSCSETDYDDEYRPGIFHVHNHDKSDIEEISMCKTPEHVTGNPTKFIAEKTQPLLEKGYMMHVRNGLYKEFASSFRALQKIKYDFVDLIELKHKEMTKASKRDIMKIQAESVANWVRFMCNSFSEAGLLPYVGKDVKVLVIQRNNHRTFILKEFSEEDWLSIK